MTKNLCGAKLFTYNYISCINFMIVASSNCKYMSIALCFEEFEEV